MSLILHYPLNQNDPLAATVGAAPTQRSGSNTVISTTDATYGTVAYFPGNGSGLNTPTPTEILGNLPRTFSVWVKRENFTNVSYPYAYGGSSDLTYWQGACFANNEDLYQLRLGRNPYALSSTVSGAFAIGKWFHIVNIYDGTTLATYVDGAIVTQLNNGNVNSSSGTLGIGHNTQTSTGSITGFMADFRIYDSALDASTIAQLFADGPNDANPSLDVTPYTHLMDLGWSAVPSASTYHVKYTINAGPEQDLAFTANLSYTMFNVVPGSLYEFRVYTNLDLVTPSDTTTAVAPSVGTISVGVLKTRLGNDLTLLSEDSVAQFESNLGSVLSTGDIVNTSVGTTTFVANSETLVLPGAPRGVVFTPFDASSGAGQTVNVVLPNTSTLAVSYDETTNEIGVGGTTYAIGESFVSGGLKVTPTEI